MSRPAVASFVDSFFTRTLFQADDELAASVLARELDPDARIFVSLETRITNDIHATHVNHLLFALMKINGNVLSSADFTQLITTRFRSGQRASITEIKDLNIVTTNDAGSTGVVGQWTSYITVGKDDGKKLRQSATTIVEVEERHGKFLVTALYEVQTTDDN
jgi:hypothetical protein